MQKAGKNSKGLSLGWGEPREEAHLANWAMVYTDKKVGSLGVRGLHKLNKALLGKWIGVSQTKGILCGGRLSEESLRKCRRDGVRGSA